MSNKLLFQDLLEHSFWENQVDRKWFSYTDDLIQSSVDNSIESSMIANRFFYWLWMVHFSCFEGRESFVEPVLEFNDVSINDMSASIKQPMLRFFETLKLSNSKSEIYLLLYTSYYDGVEKPASQNVIEFCKNGTLLDTSFIFETDHIYGHLADIYTRYFIKVFCEAKKAPF